MSFLISSNGKIILEYQKNNLWHTERKRLVPGADATCVDTPLGKIGIIICWDLAFPETCRKLAREGAEIICCPAYWWFDQTGLLEKHAAGNEKIFVNALCSARAIENNVLFIYANGAGQAKSLEKDNTWQGEFIGQTQICTPIAGTVARIEDNREGYVVYTYDRQMAKDFEKIYKIRQDLQTRLK